MELSSYISFTGQAREAMEFYQSVFGGDLAMNTFGEFGMDGEVADQIMHASLHMPSGQTLMGSDTPPGMEYSDGKRVRMIVHGEDEAQLRECWDRLVVGGSVETPLEKQMWGDIYGACTDKFGVDWMMNIAQPSA